MAQQLNRNTPDQNIPAPAPDQTPLPAADPARFLNRLTTAQLLRLRYDWSFWARDKQLPPPEDWRVWLFFGAPVMTAVVSAFGLSVPVPSVPEDLMFELLFALLGLAGLRSFDKLKGLSR